MTDWTATAEQAAKAAEAVLQGAWGRVGPALTTQLEATAKNAARAELDYQDGNLSEDDYAALKQIQINMLSGVLTAYEGLATLTVEQAVDAAWSVFATALQATIPFAV
jgi:hypothetical protein